METRSSDAQALSSTSTVARHECCHLGDGKAQRYDARTQEKQTEDNRDAATAGEGTPESARPAREIGGRAGVAAADGDGGTPAVPKSRAVVLTRSAKERKDRCTPRAHTNSPLASRARSR